MSDAAPRLDIACFTEGGARLDALRAGFSALGARPAGDPRSLAFQSALLDGLAALNAPGERVYFTWKFLPWQRGYLYFFERLLRGAAGDAALSLPYWDWTVELRVPAQYWGQGNPLCDPNRIATPTSTLDPRQVAIDALLAAPAFAAFGGSADAGGGLELGPHDYVHRFVGHDMGGLSTEGLDPLSFAHHAMVDRVFWLWAKDPAHALPLDDPAWAGQRFTFYDEAGKPVTLDVREILALPCSYAPYVARCDVTAPGAPPVALADQPVTLTAPAPDPEMRLRLRAAAAAWLRLTGITRPATEPTTVRVFLGDPGASAHTPLDSPHYAGSFTLQPQSGGGPEPAAVQLDATRALRARAEGGAVTVTLVPVGLGPQRPGIGPITIAGVALDASTA